VAAVVGPCFLGFGLAMNLHHKVSSRVGELGMKTGADIEERRTEPRFRLAANVVVQELSPTHKTPLPKTAIRGVVHDLSSSGFGLSTIAPLSHSTVVRCDIALGNVPVSIPTIAQVRWVQRAHAGEYRSGLTYLL
jgi:hypothetical protein